MGCDQSLHGFYRTVFPTGKANVATGFNFSTERFSLREKPTSPQDSIFLPSGLPIKKSLCCNAIHFIHRTVFPTGKANVATGFNFFPSGLPIKKSLCCNAIHFIHRAFSLRVKPMLRQDSSLLYRIGFKQKLPASHRDATFGKNI